MQGINTQNKQNTGFDAISSAADRLVKRTCGQIRLYAVDAPDIGDKRQQLQLPKHINAYQEFVFFHIGIGRYVGIQRVYVGIPTASRTFSYRAVYGAQFFIYGRVLALPLRGISRSTTSE